MGRHSGYYPRSFRNVPNWWVVVIILAVGGLFLGVWLSGGIGLDDRTAPGPTVTETATQTVPGPTVTTTETPRPTVTATRTEMVAKPGPVKTETVTKTKEVPGPTETVTVPGPTVTVCNEVHHGLAPGELPPPPSC